jgi:hypothetical protein
MRVPQVSERIKEAPAQALRGVFAGIGQLLLITDKLRNKASADPDVPRARTPEASETVTDAPVISPGDQGAETAPAPARPATAEPAMAEPAMAEPATAEPATAAPAEAKTPPRPRKRPSTRDFDKTGNVRLLGEEAASPPLSAAAPAVPLLPNYDELSVASLRARLRNLDVAQVRQLAEYEQAHAARVDVLGMFERRITKLEAEA